MQLRTASAVVGVAWTAVVASRGIPSWDDAVFRRVNALPGSLAPVVWLPMQAGALASPLVVAAGLAVRGDRRRAARVAVTGVAAWGAAKGLKAVIRRDRPGADITATVLRMGSAADGLGFPSGHAAVSVAVVRSVGVDLPAPVRAAGGVLAFVVGASRVYVGAHYPLDVVGGWFLGDALAGAYAGAERSISRADRARQRGRP